MGRIAKKTEDISYAILKMERHYPVSWIVPKLLNGTY